MYSQGVERVEGCTYHIAGNFKKSMVAKGSKGPLSLGYSSSGINFFTDWGCNQ